MSEARENVTTEFTTRHSNTEDKASTASVLSWLIPSIGIVSVIIFLLVWAKVRRKTQKETAVKPETESEANPDNTRDEKQKSYQDPNVQLQDDVTAQKINEVITPAKAAELLEASPNPDDVTYSQQTFAGICDLIGSSDEVLRYKPIESSTTGMLEQEGQGNVGSESTKNISPSNQEFLQRLSERETKIKDAGQADVSQTTDEVENMQVSEPIAMYGDSSDRSVPSSPTEQLRSFPSLESENKRNGENASEVGSVEPSYTAVVSIAASDMINQESNKSEVRGQKMHRMKVRLQRLLDTHGTRNDLQEAIVDFESCLKEQEGIDIESDHIARHAVRALADKTVHYVNEVIEAAINIRDPRLIKKALDEGKRAFIACVTLRNACHQRVPDTASNYGKSHEIDELFGEMEIMKKSAVKVLQTSIVEIKTYSQPQKSIFKIMQAIYIILGENPKRIKNWKQIQKLLEISERDTLKRRILQVDIMSITLEQVHMVHKLITDPEIEHIDSISKSAKYFYNWLLMILKEVRDGHPSQTEFQEAIEDLPID